MTRYARSKDGTAIAYEQGGAGPTVILVDGALCSRSFGPSGALAAALEKHFTVVRYDRRGRGGSRDTEPYELDREVEDLHALVAQAGGRASLLGLSSGGALALHAAAAGLPIDGVVVYEAPYVDEGGERSTAGHEVQLQRLIARGDRGGAVSYFMRDMVGAPRFVPIMMRLFFWMWPKLKAVAHTLPYDAAVMTGFRVPRERFATIACPVLVLCGGKTDPRLKAAARALVQAIPGARRNELPGQTHNVKPAVLAPAVIYGLATTVQR